MWLVRTILPRKEKVVGVVERGEGVLCGWLDNLA